MSQQDKNNKKWILAYTKAREEKLAQINIENQGFKTFLPLIANRNTQTSDEVSLNVIFPRYLFININIKTDNWGSINSTKGVSHLVLFGNDHAWVSEEIINLMKSKLNKKGVFYPKLVKQVPKRGEKVTINKGKFSGIDAIFLSKNSKERVRLLLNFLKNPITVNISKADIENDSFESF